MGTVLFGCNSKPEKEKSSRAQNPRGDRGVPNDEISSCRSIEALEILGDANTVISRINQNTWVSWNIDDRKLNTRGLSLNYFAASGDGEFLLSRVSLGKIQLSQLTGGVYRQKAILSLNASNYPHAEFSHDSRYVLLRYKPNGSRGMSQFDIYDIEKAQFKNSFRGVGIKFIKLADEGKSLVVGYDNSFDKFVAKYDVETHQEIFRIQLPYYLSFTYLELTQDRLVTKNRNTYSVYSLENGEQLYQGNFKHIYNVDVDGGYALVAKNWKESAVVDLSDGAEIISGKSPKDIILSSCRLKSNPLRAVCRERVEQNKIFVWGIETGESVITCY